METKLNGHIEANIEVSFSSKSSQYASLNWRITGQELFREGDSQNSFCTFVRKNSILIKGTFDIILNFFRQWAAALVKTRMNGLNLDIKRGIPSTMRVKKSART